MISAQAQARSDEYRAKQLTASIGRMALSYLTKGVSSVASTANNTAKEIKESDKPNII